MTVRSIRRGVVAAFACVLLASCGGGGGGGGGTTGPIPATPIPTSGVTPSPGTAVARISIVEPLPARTGSARTRVPSHLPDSTRTIVVTANGTQVLSVPYVIGGATCVTGASSFTCTYDASVPAGNDALVVQAQDANGKTLASAAVQQPIQGTTVVPVTLLGVPKRAAFAMALSAPLGRPTQIPISLTAYDADSNKISGTYASPILLADDDTTGHTSLSGSSIASPTDSVLLNYDGKPVNATISIPGGVDAAFFGSSIPSKRYAIPSGTTTVSTNTGTGSMIAAPDGAVWFGEQNGLGRIDANGAIAEHPIDPPPNSLAVGPDSAIWYVTARDNATGAAGELVRWNGDGTVRKFNLGAPGIRVVLGPDKNFWVTDRDAEVLRVTPAGVVTKFPLASGPGFASSYQIIVGPDGNLWVGDVRGIAYAVSTASGQIAAYSLTPTLNGHFVGLAFATDGALWATGNSAFVRLPPGGGTASQVQLLFFGSSGLVAGGAQEIPIFTASDGNLWSSTTGVFNAPYVLLRIVPQSNAVLALPLPDPRPAGTDGYGVGISAMIPGPNGTIWYEIGSTIGTFSVPQ